MLLASRLVQGAGGGTTGVRQAYVAHATEPEYRARRLGWDRAATNAGVAMGPVLGRLASTWEREMPVLLAAGLCMVNIGSATRYLRESHDVHAHAAGDSRRRGSREAVWEVIRHSNQPAP